MNYGNLDELNERASLTKLKKSGGLREKKVASKKKKHGESLGFLFGEKGESTLPGEPQDSL